MDMYNNVYCTIDIYQFAVGFEFVDYQGEWEGADSSAARERRQENWEGADLSAARERRQEKWEGADSSAARESSQEKWEGAYSNAARESSQEKWEGADSSRMRESGQEKSGGPHLSPLSRPHPPPDLRTRRRCPPSLAHRPGLLRRHTVHLLTPPPT